MDKDYLLDLMVSVRERNIDVATAVNEICAMEKAETTASGLDLQRVSNSVCKHCGSDRIEDVAYTVCKDCHKGDLQTDC